MQNIISLGVFHLCFFVGTIPVSATENRKTLAQFADLYSNHLEYELRQLRHVLIRIFMNTVLMIL